jgi:hypothetical protein
MLQHNNIEDEKDFKQTFKNTLNKYTQQIHSTNTLNKIQTFQITKYKQKEEKKKE